MAHIGSWFPAGHVRRRFFAWRGADHSTPACIKLERVLARNFIGIKQRFEDRPIVPPFRFSEGSVHHPPDNSKGEIAKGCGARFLFKALDPSGKIHVSPGPAFQPQLGCSKSPARGQADAHHPVQSN